MPPRLVVIVSVLLLCRLYAARSHALRNHDFPPHGSHHHHGEETGAANGHHHPGRRSLQEEDGREVHPPDAPPPVPPPADGGGVIVGPAADPASAVQADAPPIPPVLHRCGTEDLSLSQVEAFESQTSPCALLHLRKMSLLLFIGGLPSD